MHGAVWARDADTVWRYKNLENIIIKGMQPHFPQVVPPRVVHAQCAEIRMPRV